ncbi:MAG: DUF4258 domain-containing protein [Planctomycetes bacterium]|nr:DUF4258 domain-containing protein [Planctomycetota bacterium]
MSDSGVGTCDPLLRVMRAQCAAGHIRATLHADQEMLDEGFTLDDVVQAIQAAQVLENYPDHKRGPCCLLCGVTVSGRPVHAVCTTAQPVLVIITVYEPKPPKWVTPTHRRPRV